MYIVTMPISPTTRDAGTTLKSLGGKRLPGSKVIPIPYPKLKTPRINPLFLGETQVHVQKKNDINSPRSWGSFFKRCLQK